MSDQPQPASAPASDSKPFYTSKTIIANAIMGIAPFIPGVGDWIHSNPSGFGWIMAGLNVILRSISDKKLSFSMDF